MKTRVWDKQFKGLEKGDWPACQPPREGCQHGARLLGQKRDPRWGGNNRMVWEYPQRGLVRHYEPGSPVTWCPEKFFLPEPWPREAIQPLLVSAHPQPPQTVNEWPSGDLNWWLTNLGPGNHY